MGQYIINRLKKNPVIQLGGRFRITFAQRLVYP